MEILVTIGYIALCVLFFSLAIAIHEFGHFIVALKLGLKVERFSLGFGPAIWKRTWRGVEYRVSCIPLGGYVAIPDVDPEGTKAIEGGAAKAPRARIPAWKELAVAFAGPAMNIVLAVVLALALSTLPEERFGELPTLIGSVQEGGPAEKAGLKAGDRVVSIGAHAVRTWTELLTEVQITGGKPTEFRVERDGKEVALTVEPVRNAVTGMYYINAVSIRVENGVPGTWMQSRNPWRQLSRDAGAIFRVLKGLVTPKEMKATANALGGPQIIAEGIYYSVRADFWNGVGFLRFLNVNLAVLNLLPIPVLDGGLILFALIAIVFRRRVPDKVVGTLSMGFMYLLLAAMAVLIFKDARRSWRIHHSDRSEIPAVRPAAEANTQTNAYESTDTGAEGR